MTLKLTVAGHIVKDVTADDWQPGGGVLYAASQAVKLGREVVAVTACATDIDPKRLLPEVNWQVQASDVTTTFQNSYRDGRREQHLLARGAPLDVNSVFQRQEAAGIVLLTPLFHEIDREEVQRAAGSGGLLGVASQGWLRELDGDRVQPAAFDDAPAWLAGDVVFVSDEDVQDADSVAAWRAQVPVVALTRGRAGCTVWNASGRHDVSTAVVRERDPTGAGDVFAAAFMVRYYETRDALTAARFAAAAGALAVRGEGYASVAGRDEIEALLRRGQVKVA